MVAVGVRWRRRTRSGGSSRDPRPANAAADDPASQDVQRDPKAELPLGGMESGDEPLSAQGDDLPLVESGLRTHADATLLHRDATVLQRNTAEVDLKMIACSPAQGTVDPDGDATRLVERLDRKVAVEHCAKRQCDGA